MEIRSWQELAHTVLQPLLAFESATIRAMPVTTTVILVMRMITTIALIHMHSDSCCVAIRQLFQHTLTVWIELLG